MNELELMAVRERIKTLYETAPNVHVNIVTTTPKRILKSDPATIVGVSRYVFRIEEESCGVKRLHTVPYTDIMTKKIEIVEF